MFRVKTRQAQDTAEISGGTETYLPHVYESAVAPIMPRNETTYATQISSCGECNWLMAPAVALLDPSPGQWGHTSSDWAQWEYSAGPLLWHMGFLFSDFGSKTPHQAGQSLLSPVLHAETLPS